MTRLLPPLLAALLLALTGCTTNAEVAPGARAEQAAQVTAQLTVAQAIDLQNNGSETVRGFVVGQPTSADKILRGNFSADTALVLADSATETDPGAMLFVQIGGAFRNEFGLRSNPDLFGTQVDVTGTLSAYFARPGLKSPTALTRAGGPAPTTQPPASSVP